MMRVDIFIKGKLSVLLVRLMMKKYKNGIPTRRVIKTRSLVIVNSVPRKGTVPKFRDLKVSRDLDACMEYWCKRLDVLMEDM